MVPYSKVQSSGVEKFVADGGTLDTLDIEHLHSLTEIIQLSTKRAPGERATYAVLRAILAKDPESKASSQYGNTAGSVKRPEASRKSPAGITRESARGHR